MLAALRLLLGLETVIDLITLPVVPTPYWDKRFTYLLVSRSPMNWASRVDRFWFVVPLQLPTKSEGRVDIGEGYGRPR